MKQPIELPINITTPMAVPVPVPVPLIEGNGKSKAIEILEKKGEDLEKRIREMEMGACPLGQSHDQEIKIMRARIHDLNNQLMIFIGQRQAISWIPQLIQTVITLAGFWILYVHGNKP